MRLRQPAGRAEGAGQGKLRSAPRMPGHSRKATCTARDGRARRGRGVNAAAAGARRARAACPVPERSAGSSAPGAAWAGRRERGADRRVDGSGLGADRPCTRSRPGRAGVIRRRRARGGGTQRERGGRPAPRRGPRRARAAGRLTRALGLGRGRGAEAATGARSPPAPRPKRAAPRATASTACTWAAGAVTAAAWVNGARTRAPRARRPLRGARRPATRPSSGRHRSSSGALAARAVRGGGRCEAGA